ncbi:MAG: LPS export ABC transporter ATP-binding protein [Gammaproteobacteria bacterium]|nr:LPS export ABC transporter ATP-binding protein [Gammaproteobacteria bacterium]
MAADESTSACLAVREISKSFRSRKVVDRVSLTLRGGEVVGLLGPNGAGKTTTFYMIVGLIPCDQGVIEVNGQDVTHKPMHVRARMGVGYLPQEASVFRRLTVAENVMAILQTRKDLDVDAKAQQLEELLDALKVEHLRDHLGMSLSGGERRRVEIARALAMRPRFILLDEPFAGVDPISVLEIQGIIRYLSEIGIGVLITDHNVRETLGSCQHAYIVNAGKVIATGTPDEILADRQVREVYLGQHFRL